MNYEGSQAFLARPPSVRLDLRLPHDSGPAFQVGFCQLRELSRAAAGRRQALLDERFFNFRILQ